jgi:uncharacterized damage-inducible protein DinB
MAEANPTPIPDRSIEPWLRDRVIDLPALQCAVLNSLQLATEDVDKCCSSLSRDELNARPGGIAPVAFHVRHIARSTDRLLTYAEGNQLDATQLELLKSELQPNAPPEQLLLEFTSALETCAARIYSLAGVPFELPRSVGRKQLPTTVGGLLVHVAEHTQRHVGQAITTAKIVMSQRQK